MAGALSELNKQLASYVDLPTWSLTEADVIAGIDAAHAAVGQSMAVLAHLVREFDGRGMAKVQHAPNTSTWLRGRLRVDPAMAKRLVRLGGILHRATALDDALGTGAISAEHVDVIGKAVQRIPAVAGVAAAADAEAVLLQAARDYEPHVVRRVGEQVLSIVAPEIAEQADADAVARMDREAEAARCLTLTDLGDGRHRLSGYLTAEGAAIVNAAIDPLSKPIGAAGTDERTAAQRRVDALVEVCDLALHTGTLPDNGGDRPQVVVTTDYDTLCGQLGCGLLDTGHRLSPETVRRMACDALIIPAILDSKGQPLDVGRAKRSVDGAIRRALVLRDGGCAFPGCDRHPRWCVGHHVQHWSHGGVTSLQNSALLCRRHHWLIHHSEWEVRIAADGLPEFIPPSYVDPDRRPRRNPYHGR